MIINLDNEFKAKKQIEELIGKPFSLKQRILKGNIGSCSFNLRSLYFLQSVEKQKNPSENARCNFEKYEKGILLRINDNQKLYGVILSEESVKEIKITRGDRTLRYSLDDILALFGVGKKYINQLIQNSFEKIHKRFLLILNTKTVKILLDSSDSNFKKGIEFFKNSLFENKLTVIE